MKNISHMHIKSDMKWLWKFGNNRKCLRYGTIHINKKGSKDHFRHYINISHIKTTYKVLAILLLRRLTNYAEDISDNYQSGFRVKMSTIDQIFPILTNTTKELEIQPKCSPNRRRFAANIWLDNKKQVMAGNTSNGYHKIISGTNRNVRGKLICTAEGRKQNINAIQCNIRTQKRRPMSPWLFNFALEYAGSIIASELIEGFDNQGSKLLLAFAAEIHTVAHSTRDVGAFSVITLWDCWKDNPN